MSALARVLEQHGIVTVALSLVRRQAVRTRPPRALHVDFPLGRPLGRPNDPSFQRRVLQHAFDLLDRPSGPVLEDFPERVDDDVEQPLACPVPPPVDDVDPEVAEAIGLRDAYDRHVAGTGRTGVGRVVEAAAIPAAVAVFVAVARGVAPEDLDLDVLPEQLADLAMDVRAYFEEAAAELAGHTPAARAAESWFFRSTRFGAAVRAARRRLAEAGQPRSLWWGMAPISQEDPDVAERLWQQSRGR